jgi:NAD(P)H-hydrate repair Nnr-like enzyme with NAD(P)H-hydrate epimerase domain
MRPIADAAALVVDALLGIGRRIPKGRASW